VLTELYQSILNSLSEGVCAVDLEMRIGCFNLEAARLTGISPQDVLGKGLDAVFASQTNQWTEIVEQVSASSQPLKGLLKEIIRHDGTRIPVTVSAAPIHKDGGARAGVVLTFQDNRAIELLRRELRRERTFGDIVSKDKEIQRILDILPHVAESESAVLILGPTGTGKELFARAIHTASPRKNGPFIAVNCGALPDTLLESELFGYKKGAFTDAKHDKPGRFARAKGGTLFLDEVGDLSPAMQVKLMRVLQEKQYEPLGATTTETADVRVISATNRDLAAMMKSGEFRPDLYFRLNVMEFTLPPLAERAEDIPLLVEHFIEQINAEKGRNIHRISQSAMRRLIRYHYPGNIRELKNIIERAYVLCRFDEIRDECLPEHIANAPPPPASFSLTPPRSRLHGKTMEEQRVLIQNALQENGSHRGRTAEALGIDRTTLWRKMKQLGIGLSGHNPK